MSLTPLALALTPPPTPTHTTPRPIHWPFTYAEMEEGDFERIVDHILLTKYEVTNFAKRWRFILVLRPSDKSPVSDITINIHILPTGIASVFSSHTPAPRSDVEFRIELGSYGDMEANGFIDFIVKQHTHIILGRQKCEYNTLQWCADMLRELDRVGYVKRGSYKALYNWLSKEGHWRQDGEGLDKELFNLEGWLSGCSNVFSEAGSTYQRSYSPTIPWWENPKIVKEPSKNQDHKEEEDSSGAECLSHTQ